MSSDQTADESQLPAVSLVETPPATAGGILVRLGPGLIVAGSIVGSGELIATTATGAHAGFWLLWLILIGCLIKVFVQVEMGRYTITSGKTTMDGLADVPGPRIPGRGNWLVWYWLLMFMASLAQLGGIVGGVGQALAISAPLTSSGASYNEYVEAETKLIVTHAELRQIQHTLAGAQGHNASKTSQLRDSVVALEQVRNARLIALKESELRKTQSAGTSRDAQDRIERLSGELASLHALREKIRDVKQAEPRRKALVARLFPINSIQYELFAAEKSLDERRRRNKDVAKQKRKVEQLSAQFEEAKDALRPLEDEFGFSIVDVYLAAGMSEKPPAPIDDKWWATIVTAITVVVLVIGRYGLIQAFATAMVASFTLITIVNLLLLQSSPSWGVSVTDIINGMSFRLPPGNQAQSLATALATFGIIGVGASELVTYPYWCLEKGYARFTGPREFTPQWADRAQGWMRVMRWDAWCSMVVYTFATLAFYLLGAAILHRSSLDPKGTEMIRYLSVMYAPVFGQIAQILFLFGAFAVLYSTFFVANASQARVLADVLRVMRFAAEDEAAYRRRVRLFSGLLPIVCLSVYWSGAEPQGLVLLSGLMQAMMLPMLSAAALYFRYYRCDDRIRPGRVWDVFLWISAAGMLVTGSWAAWSNVIAPLLLSN